ncbi:MAG: DUF4399 domain-containing protein [Candidatus Nitronauta litoralis]|uniref:DUF4399 domain-containing protein n=1 Tax=Candidatus Nitronauta litoralis TaxID=2705533 RepID=A0A7T0BTS1_9BACT|nr:MAG: DUF4399 domain-containing protein [Candidatus Nitronauta litoralis]
MKKKCIYTLLIFYTFLGIVQSQAQERKVTIIKPLNGDTVGAPVEVCIKVEGLELEPAKMGVNEGKGHHHILFSSLPKDLSKPLGKQEVIHMGSGVACHTLNLAPGTHSLLALFAYGNHVPYNPPISDKILISVHE